MNLDRILELLAKQMGDGASDDELAELQQLLERHPNHQHIVDILKSIRSKRLRQPVHNEELVLRDAWEKMRLVMEDADGPPKAAVRWWTPLRWAAIWTGLILLCGVVYVVSRKHRGEAGPLQEIVSQGRPKMTTLPDGSVVWMNAGTKIGYREEPGIRAVYLEGEAYFSVRQDAERTFMVHAGTIAVRALGTAFNVLAYPGEDHVETTLIEGKVQITMEEKPDQKIILVPSEKLTIVNHRIVEKDTAARREITYEVKPVKILPALNSAEEVAWMQDRLAFQDESFSELAKRLERRYGVHIAFDDESLKSEALSGIFKNESIEKALRLLQMTTPFRYRMKGDSVFLDRR
jgi:transmembrane sensor